jgi:hypothetical protein
VFLICGPGRGTPGHPVNDSGYRAHRGVNAKRQ